MPKICASLLVLAWCLTAQIPSGSIAGSAVDDSGARIAGATVEVRSGTTAPRRCETDSEGSFRIANLPPGDFDLTVAKPGFRVLRQHGVHVDAGGAAQLHLTMQVGAVNESVDVTASNEVVTSESLLNLDTIFSFDEIMHLVQDERTITDLAYLIAGVSRRAHGGLGSGFVVGGARADNTNFILDGFSNYDARGGGQQNSPNYDAIQEFRVQTSGSAAEYGHLAGGVMDVVLRAGSSRFHGSGFEFYRPGALAARNFFDVQKSYLLRNQFGATFGGPVIVPHVYHSRDKLLFLVSWEGLRQNAGENRFTEVPTALERSGDFSASRDSTGRAVTILDPLNGNKPFPADQVPANRISPVARQLASYFPLPNSADASDNFHANQVDRSHFESFLGKLDVPASEKDTFSFRYVTRLNATASPYSGSDLGSFGANAKTRPSLVGANYTHIFNPSVANEFRTGFNRLADHEASIYAGQDVNSWVGLPAVSDPHQLGFPRINVLNMAVLGDSPSMPVDFTENSYEVADAVTYAHGHHVLKAGADLLRTQYFQKFYNNTRGTFNFLGRWTGAPFADFLLGEPDSTSRQTATSPAYWFYTDWGAFVQDQYEAGSHLTLSIGLRYEMIRPPQEKYGRSSSFVRQVGELVVADGRAVPNLAQQMAAAGLTGLVTTAQSAGLPSALAYANDLDLAPRFGFAFRPGSRTMTVIRGGYGIYYADSLVNPLFNDLSNVYPFDISQTFNRVTSNAAALTLQNPFPSNLAVLPGVTNVHGYNLHPRPQYLQGYTFSVERQIGSATTVEVEYDGSRGTHLERQYDLNQPFRFSATFAPRPYPGFGTITYYDFGSNSVYNAGSVTIRRAYRNGLFFGASYIYGKSLDDASQASGNSQGDYPGAQDSRDLAAERGRSDWDTGHALYLFGSYALPFHLRVAHGWQVSLTGRFYTGQPFTPRVANANLTLGEANRPDRTAKGTLAAPGVNGWFNLGAFPVVPAGAYRFGNSGRNILDGPGSANVNCALMRNFRMGEKVRLQLRGEAVNVTNRANLGLPVNFVDAQNAARILTADPGRILQFGARLSF